MRRIVPESAYFSQLFIRGEKNSAAIYMIGIYIGRD